MDMLDHMYKPYGQEIAAFGSNWCGPEKYGHFEKVKVAFFNKPDGSDGHPVEIYCFAAPARFYELKVLDTFDSCGDFKQGWEVITGSGAWRMAAEMAKAIADGMLVWRGRDTPQSP